MTSMHEYTATDSLKINGFNPVDGDAGIIFKFAYFVETKRKGKVENINKY